MVLSNPATPVRKVSADLMQKCILVQGRQRWKMLAGEIWSISSLLPKRKTLYKWAVSHLMKQWSFHVACLNAAPVLVLNVTTKTDTIWSFSSHFTILSSSNASLGSESAWCSSLPARSPSSLPARLLEVAGVALQPSVSDTDLLLVGPPGTLLHPNPGAEHPDEARLFEGLDRRSFACAAGGAAPSGFSADGTSSQSSRGARSDRSTILTAVPPRHSHGGS